MGTQLVERRDWRAFFDGFSRAHDGWLVTLEVLDARLGDQIEVENVPLRGITVNADGSFEISLGRDRTHLSHAMSAPSRVFLKQTRPGVDEIVEFEGLRATTLLYFRSPMAGIEVDGL